MTRYINKGSEGYQPFAPQHPHILSHGGSVAETVNKDGLFYLRGERSAHEVTSITDYQEWCEVGWKQEHGSYEAGSRFIDKLLEETAEAGQALNEFREAGSDRESEEAKELLSELGDILWCTTALASNSTADIDTGLKNRLSEYVAGVLDYSKGSPAPMQWRETAGRLSNKFTDINLEDIDELLDATFEPLPTPIMNIWDDEPQFGIRQHFDLILMNGLGIRNAVSQQYAYGELDDTYVMPALYDKQSSDISIEAAEIVLNIAYIAKHELGATLSEVINKNIAKINGRVQAGRVDKTDGQRDAHLLQKHTP